MTLTVNRFKYKKAVTFVTVQRSVCYVYTGDSGGDLPAHWRVQRIGIDRRQVLHGPRVRRLVAEWAGQSFTQCTSLRSSWTGTQEQDCRIPSGRRRNLGHGSLRMQNFAICCCDAVLCNIFTCVSYAEARNRYMLDVCLSVCLSHAGTLSKRLNILSCFLHHTIAHSF